MDVQVCEPGHARIVLMVRPDMLNGHGVCHGGVMFTLADMAMALSTNAGETTSVATHAEIDFMEAVPAGSTITAEARQRIQRSKQSITDVTITNEAGLVMAEFRGRTLAVKPK